MSRAAGYPWWMGLASWATAGVLMALGSTWRISYHRVREYEQELARGQRCIYALWHARLLPLIFTHRHRQAAVLISASRDGEWIARVIRHFGYHSARGSSTRRGEEGVRELLDFAARGHLLAITPDGPRGPAGRVKAGLVYVASRTGLPVVPAAAAANRAWTFRSWDALRLPQPFARVATAYGDPIEVPGHLSDADAEAYRQRIEHALNEVSNEVAAIAGETP